MSDPDDFRMIKDDGCVFNLRSCVNYNSTMKAYMSIDFLFIPTFI